MECRVSQKAAQSAAFCFKGVLCSLLLDSIGAHFVAIGISPRLVLMLLNQVADFEQPSALEVPLRQR